MADISNRCQELLDEYHMLRRRLEEENFTNPDIDDEDFDEDDDDETRLEELAELLEEECDIDVFAEDFEEETDLDIPEYAAESPSEPMEFDVE